ncbi:MAG: VOC family protein [Myxococcota bacterium]
MNVMQLGYVTIASAELEGWRSFACEVLGLMPNDALCGEDRLVLRSDERAQRVSVESGPLDRFLAAGWELADAAALEAAGRELEAAGVAVAVGSREECAARRVQSLLRARDPAGNSFELFHGAEVAAKPWASPVTGQRFVAGELGLGHVVLPAPCHDECRDFYTDVLGFRMSDFFHAGPMQISFLHCNPRHHSLALVGAESPAGLWHLMFEVSSLEEVVAARDRLAAKGDEPRATLGRHTNDRMLSFYLRSPSGFDVEFGCQGILVDDASWQVEAMSAPSFWGHQWATGDA